MHPYYKIRDGELSAKYTSLVRYVQAIYYHKRLLLLLFAAIELQGVVLRNHVMFTLSCCDTIGHKASRIML